MRFHQSPRSTVIRVPGPQTGRPRRRRRRRRVDGKVGAEIPGRPMHSSSRSPSIEPPPSGCMALPGRNAIVAHRNGGASVGSNASNDGGMGALVRWSATRWSDHRCTRSASPRLRVSASPRLHVSACPRRPFTPSSAVPAQAACPRPDASAPRPTPTPWHRWCVRCGSSCGSRSCRSHHRGRGSPRARP